MIEGIDREAIATCVHCGLCLETCPTFVATGREEDSPRGRLVLMDALASGRFPASPDVVAPLDRCLGCRACETACPAGVQYGDVLESTRSALHRSGAVPRDRLEFFLVRQVLWRGRLLARAAGLYRGLGLGRLARALSQNRSLPVSWRRRLSLAPNAERPVLRPCPTAPPGAPVASILRGCAARALFPGSEAAIHRLLDAAGYRVNLLETPDCCGAMHQHLGDEASARTRIRSLLERAPEDSEILVPTASGCGAHLRSMTDPLDPEMDRRARAWGERVRDLTEAILEGPRPLRFRTEPPLDVVYQDACHLRHAQRILDPPRDLLRQAGVQVREPADPDLCCGSAGSYNLGCPELAEQMGRAKALALVAAGGGPVVTANPGCAIQLGAYLDRPVVPLARLLADRLHDSLASAPENRGSSPVHPSPEGAGS